MHMMTRIKDPNYGRTRKMLAKRKVMKQNGLFSRFLKEKRMNETNGQSTADQGKHRNTYIG